MQCPKCTYKNEPDNQYCGNCGAKLVRICPGCAKENPSDHRFCGKCGTPLSGESSTTQVEAGKAGDSRVDMSQSDSDSEVRHLTLMFCDLVGSTALSSSLDAEDFRLLIRDYQSTSEKVISRFEGYIAQYLGDGLLVYFGFPVAHEDDARRAVHSGLGILKEMEELNKRLQSERNIRLDVRIGIHSGMVVVGEVGAGKRSERLALGDTTNIAARIEGVAQKGTMAISKATLQLVKGFFDTEDLGAHALKGIAKPVDVFRVTGVSAAKSRLDVEELKGLTPLIGRQQEMNFLMTRWEEAKNSQSRVVLLNGGAGMGKSRLIRELRDTALRDGEVSIVQYYSSQYHKNSAFYPVIENLNKEIFNIEAGGVQNRELRQIEDYVRQKNMPLEQTVPLFAALFSIPFEKDYAGLGLSAERQKQKTIEALMLTLLNSSRVQPLMLIVEDLHWIDASTMELINLILKQSPRYRILIVLSFRPEFIPAWGVQPHITSIYLSHLPPSDSRAVVRQIAESKALPEEIVTQIIAKTDGIPLFVEELTKSVLESGQLRELEHAYELSIPAPAMSIPGTLHDALVARLDRLGADKEIAQLGSAIGREFSFELYHAITMGNQDELEEGLAHLVSSGLLDQVGIPPNATYQFRHALVQDAAYQSLLKKKRCQYHERIGQVLEDQFGDRLETRPEMIAHHYTEAGLTENAIKYWYEAGIRASQRWEHLETIAHLDKGLRLISTLPDSTQRDEEELAFRVALGPSLIVIRGYGSSDVCDDFSRSLELCEKLDRRTEVGQILWGLGVHYIVRGEYQNAMLRGRALLDIGNEQVSNSYKTGGHVVIGGTSFGLANFEMAQSHLDQGSALYLNEAHEEQVNLYGTNLGIFSLLWETHALWHLGRHDLALKKRDQGFAVAEKVDHPFSWVIAYDYTAMLHQFRREPHIAKEHAQGAIAICREHHFGYYLGWAMIINGWATSALGDCKEGISEIHQGLEMLKSTSGKRSLPYYNALLAEAYWMNGQNELAVQTLKTALIIAEKITEPWWTAEIHRLKGDILLSTSSENKVQAETSFMTALKISREQKSTAIELRVAISLSRLWHEQGKAAEAKKLLSERIEIQTEGFDTPDFVEAQKLLASM